MFTKEAKEVYDELIEVYRRHGERGLSQQDAQDAALALLFQLISWSDNPEETARAMAETLVGMARKWVEEGRSMPAHWRH